jgi:predicted RNA-binding protein YlqC (UPF0109 family)
MATPYAGDVRALIEMLAKSLVDAPDAVSVEAVETDRGTELQLTVAEGDFGKVIGKQGRTARCLRNIANAAGIKANKRVTVEIVE